MTEKLRVLIDARMLMGRFSGVARMVTQLVEHMTTMPQLRVVALCGNQPYEPWIGRSDLELLVSDFAREDRTPIRRFWWEAAKLRHWIVRSGADVFHATWNTGVPFRCPIPSILTVHDLIPWDDPVCGGSAGLGRLCYRYSLRASVRRAHRVVTVSGFTADEVVRKAGVDPSRTRVIYNGVESTSSDGNAATHTDQPYVLYVGGFEPRKNLESVFRSVERYWSQHDPEMELHLTGSVHQLCKAARNVYELLGHEGRIKFLGSPGDDELAREYAGAKALLMLSRAEGFGLPVIEAMAYDCPVIAARCGALPEIVGNAGILVDPDNADEVGNALHRVVRTPEFADELVAKGRKRVECFTWNRAAEAYLREYQWAALKVTANGKQSVSTVSTVATDLR